MFIPILASQPPVVSLNRQAHLISIRNESGSLALRLNWSKGCVVDEVMAMGRQVEKADHGVASGVKVGGHWYMSDTLSQTPVVSKKGNEVVVTGIAFGGGGVKVQERWTFDAGQDTIRWRIDRKYLTGGTLEDTAMPIWTFQNMSTWTGALLGTGGVAWGKLFDAPNATYAMHTDSATLWDPKSDACLRYRSLGSNGTEALRFSRQPDDGFSLDAEVSQTPFVPKGDLARFHRDRQDVWAPFPVSAGASISSSFELSAFPYSKGYSRGDLKGVDGKAVTELLNTIGRIGVVDRNLVGSNGWYSGYVVLHEPWLGLIGSALDDPNYVRSYAECLDFERDHAILPSGLVKSRWAYNSGDSTPGTYGPEGFYEAQWGRLMDSQSSYVTNVTDEFDLNGDIKWAQGQKKACEMALDYLLKRDTNGNHLVEMEPDSEKQRRSSDWLDIVWASFENALVNAQLYHALQAWSNVELVLGDKTMAGKFQRFASKLKVSFNKPISEGGFWDQKNGWYIYWRDKDGWTHGDNLVIPVNLTALGYGLCEGDRRTRLLATMEHAMTQEGLLSWPACMTSFDPKETANQHWPEYENGDIFLAWAEYGIRAYAPTQPQTALKYVKNILAQYKKDGLAFQRYLRSSQQGAGDDILANNCNAMVGLYRDIYGIKPKFNRLELDPHLTPELNGTRVNYKLRGEDLNIDLSVDKYKISCKGLSVVARRGFGVSFGDGLVTYYEANIAEPTFSLTSGSGKSVSIDVRGIAKGEVSVTAGSSPVKIAISYLRPRKSGQGLTSFALAAGKTKTVKVVNWP